MNLNNKIISRQLRWRHIRREAGLCVQCGKPSSGLSLCLKCTRKSSDRQGCKPYQPGDRGRVPIKRKY